MKNRKIVKEWLIRARSNISRAQVGTVSEEILLEDLCFDCQQAVEKSLKGLIIAVDREAPRTHNIAHLLEILEATGLTIPELIINASDLTEYAVETRYPGIYEPVSMEDYSEALNMAEQVYAWVKAELSHINDELFQGFDPELI